MKMKKIVAILLTTIIILLAFNLTAKARIERQEGIEGGGGASTSTSGSHEVTGSGPIGNPWDFKPGDINRKRYRYYYRKSKHHY